MTAGDGDATAREAARAAIDERLLLYGVETQDVLEMQADFLFLRQLRRAAESVRNKGLWVMVTLAAAGFAVLAAAGVKHWLGGSD